MKAGTRLGGRYRLERRLGQGGMGQVWLAHDERLGRDVAVKTLRNEVGDVSDALRLRREARAAAALGDRGIAQVYDIEATPDGLLYIVMELVEGRSLRERLAKEGPLPVDDVRSIVAEVAGTLQRAHDAGLVHRDIKPDNLMQRPDGSIVVLDFGLAKDLSPTRSVEAHGPTEAELTDSGALLGTPAYLSPEQARNRDVGPATDQWALAITAWELLTGRTPWSGETIPEILVAILEEEPPLASDVRADVPVDLAERLARAMKKDARERFDRVEELATRRSATAAPRRPVISRRRGAVLAVVGYLLVGALSGRTFVPANENFVPQPGEAALGADGTLELASGDDVTPLDEGWTVMTAEGVWRPLDLERGLADQGFRARQTMRYRLHLRIPPEDVERARRRGLSLGAPGPYADKIVVVDGRSLPCERIYIYGDCVADGVERGLRDDGRLDLEVEVSVPSWTLLRSAEPTHLRRVQGDRVDGTAIGPTPMVRMGRAYAVSFRQGIGAHLSAVLALVFALLGFTRREVAHYRYIALFLAVDFVYAANNTPSLSWAFPIDPWPFGYLVGHVAFMFYGLAMLEVTHRLVKLPTAPWVRALQLAHVAVCGVGMMDIDGPGYQAMILSTFAVVLVCTACCAVGVRRGEKNATPLLWAVAFIVALVVFGPIFAMLGVNPGLFFHRSGITLAWGLAFGYIAARDYFEARAALEESNRSLERRVRERTLALARANAKLTELDQAKTRFFENVSHELRTPLTLILGPLGQVLGRGDLADDVRTPLEGVAKHARRLLRMVNRLLDVQRLDAGRMHVDAARTDVAALARRVADAFTAAADARQIALTVDAARAVEADVDPRLFEDVLFNLLSNALKFTPEGGRVRLTVSSDGQSRRPVRIEVRDSGVGIPKAQLAHVFERFRRVESRRRSGGTGVGLALVKEIVAAHRGTIDVESELDFGTTLTIRLPAARLDEASEIDALDEDRLALELAHLDERRASEVDRDVAADARPLLLVDDHDDLRAYVRSCLEDEYRVIEARDGEEALAILESGERVDVIVSDVMMPRMDGYELLDRVRSAPALSALPFVLLTANSSIDKRVEGIEAGADDYVAKPFDPAELRVRVRNVLRLRSLA